MTEDLPTRVARIPFGVTESVIHTELAKLLLRRREIEEELKFIDKAWLLLDKINKESDKIKKEYMDKKR